MPRYGDGSPYQFGNSFSNHSSLMTTTASGRLHGPLVSRYSPHLSTISESPLSHLRRYSPALASTSRPKRVDTADIDVSTPRNLARADPHGRNRLRRDRPTIRIRSQALKDNPALRELNEKHEKTVGELLVEKFFIREKTGVDPTKLVKIFQQPSLESKEAIQKKVTRRLTRRRSSLEIPTDSEIIAREVIIAQAQAEALDSLVEQEQAQIKVEARRRSLVKRNSIPASAGSSDNESCEFEEAGRPSLKKTIKKTKKKKKIPSKILPQPEDDEEEIPETPPHLKQTKSDSNLILQGPLSREHGEEMSRFRPQKFKIEACNSVGDFSTLWINASSAPTSPIATEQFRESIRLPAPKSIKDLSINFVIDDEQSESEDDAMVVLALPKKFVRDSTRNSVHLTLKTAAQETNVPKIRITGKAESVVENSESIDQLVKSRQSTKRLNNLNSSVIDPVNKTDSIKDLPKSKVKTTSPLKNVENFANVFKTEIPDEQSKADVKIPDHISKIAKKPVKKLLISQNNKAVNLKQVDDVSRTEESILPVKINGVSVPEKLAKQSLNNITKPTTSRHDVVEIGTGSEAQPMTEDFADNISSLNKKTIKESSTQDLSVRNSANNLNDVENSKPRLSNTIETVSVPETIVEKSLNDLTKFSKATQEIVEVGTSSEPRVVTEKLTNNIITPAKKIVKKSNSQLKDTIVKKASQNLDTVLNGIFEVLVPPTKPDDIVELSKPVKDIKENDESSEQKAIETNSTAPPIILGLKNTTEINTPSSPISEVDFWGEIEPESTPITTPRKLSLKINKVISGEKHGDAAKEVTDTSILAKTDLDQSTKLEGTRQISTTVVSEQDSKDGVAPATDVIIAIDKTLSIVIDNTPVLEVNDPSKNNVSAKDEGVNRDGDELLTPVPANEKGTANSMESQLPTINIVAAPISPGGINADTQLDEDPGTPTNEWLNASLTMSKWESQNDLCDTTENVKEVTPNVTPPNGTDPGVSPGSSKKKKLVKKKKSPLKKAGSEDSGSAQNSQKNIEPIKEKSPKPSPQNSSTCSPRSSPRNSHKHRPADLIRMFYTTPGPLLTATPRDLSKVRRGGRRRKRNLSTTSSASDSTESVRSTQSTNTESTEDTSSTCTEGAEETKDEKRLTSTRSNDSGFDGSPRLTNCDMACHKKCEKLTGNLCGLNQKLVAEALQALKQAPSQSSDSQRSEKLSRFQLSGRITPPATNLPRFKKYAVTDFNFLKVLGKGSFGKVLLAELRDTDCLYAVKCLKKDVVLEDDDVECTLIERKVLTLATRHPYLCHLFCTFQTDSHLFFVMEYLNGGDLMFHIQRAGRFPEPRARFYAAEILSGLNFLHKKGIVYRDLKLDNVLLDFDGHIRIADFGMCKLQIYLDRTADTFCGTPDYMAPEIIKGMKYNQAVDWWSYGVLLYEMLTGQSPFSGCDEDELFWSICNERPFIPRYLTQEATDILVCLLEKDSGKRLPGHEIAIHPFFQGLPWDRLERRQLEPPFKPALEHTLDTRYFDSTFTAERPRLSIVPEQILISMDQEVFRGFSYTNPNATD